MNNILAFYSPVAVSHLIYDTFPGATANPNNNPVCGRKIAATWSGNTVTVTVQDEVRLPLYFPVLSPC